MSDLFEHLAALAKRERAAMERGDTLDVVIKRLREEGLGTVAVGQVVRYVKDITLSAAKQLVALDSGLPKLDLDNLALLASIPRACKSAWWLQYQLEGAIIDRKPRVRFDGERRDEVKRAIAEEPEWAREIEVLRDEPELFEIRFVRIR